MRLERYIAESKDKLKVGETTYDMNEINQFMKAWEKVEKDCRYFLDDLRRGNASKELIWRGLSSSHPDIGKKDVRKERRPKDSSIEWHNAFDAAFKSLFGWNARSEGLFATSDKSETKHYGNPYIIFPIGRYQILWSASIPDLYTKIENYSFDPPDSWYEELREQWEDEYGEGNQGQWLYGNGIGAFETGENDKKDAIAKVLEDWHDNNDDEDEEPPTERDIESELEWEPYITFSEYKENQYYEPSEDDYYEIAYDIVKDGHYKQGDLRGLLSVKRKPEVMIKTDSYHFFDEYYYDLVLNAVFNSDNPDPRQMKLDF